MGARPPIFRSTRSRRSPSRVVLIWPKRPIGGRIFSAFAARWARNRRLPRVVSSTSRRSPSSSAASPCTARRSKNTLVSISALGSGVLVQRRNRLRQVETGCRQASVRAIISPGQ